MLKNKLNSGLTAKHTNLSEVEFDKKDYEYRGICTC